MWHGGSAEHGVLCVRVLVWGGGGHSMVYCVYVCWLGGGGGHSMVYCVCLLLGGGREGA